MTIETKTTIQLSDIKAVEFECKNCHRVVSWPLDTARNPPFSCECAGSPQWMSVGGDTYRDLTHLIALIQRYGKSNGEQFVLRFTVNGLLEINRTHNA